MNTYSLGTLIAIMWILLQDLINLNGTKSQSPQGAL